eukprot:Stramenopile-MAST_4_protein_2607
MKRGSNTIDVAVRVRPNLTSGGRGDADSCRHSVPESVQQFSYPSAVIVGSDQCISFDAIGAPLLSKMSAGYNTTLLAYGQTGSGKTYTVFGPTGSLTEASLQGKTTKTGVPVAWGIFPRVALAMVEDSGGNLKASAIEIYNNSPFDLLNDRKQLQVSRSKNAGSAGVRVKSKGAPEGGSQFNNYKVGLSGEHPPGCYCRECFKAQEAAKEAKKKKIAIARGEVPPPKNSRSKSIKKSSSAAAAGDEEGGRARTVGETLWDIKSPKDVAHFARQIEASRVAHGHALNERSSRSHCLVRLLATRRVAGGSVTKQCFTFVDLAGSERTGKTGVGGQRMSEAISINNALTVLGRCIRGVGSGSMHIPWRDSVLTRLLRNSFDTGAGTHTAVVVNVTPEHHDETLCTLRFGETVAGVANRATMVVGRNIDHEVEGLRSDIRWLQDRKKSMERAGQGSGFVDGCILSEKLSLRTNMEKLKSLQSHLAQLKIKRMEVGSTLADKLETTKREEYNLRMLVLRQQSIKKLWHEATPAYLKLVAELDEKKNQLNILTIK